MRAGVIGAGRMGRRHMQIVGDLGLDLAGICDASPAALAEAAEEFGVPEARRFTDAEALVGEVAPECLVVATTAPSHCELVCTAAAGGVAFILCEKPMAVSLEECDRMIAACAAADAHLAVNHQMRFMEQYTLTRELASSERFGGLRSISVSGGNFGLAMNGTHYFEMLRFMSGDEPAEVAAWFSSETVPNPRGASFEDRAGSVRVTTRNGCRFYMDVSADQGHGVHVVYATRNGSIAIDELTGELRFSVRRPEHAAQPTTRYGMPADIETRAIVPADAVAPSRAVLDALITDADFPTGTQGRLAVATLVAAYVSHEAGHVPVRVDDALPRERVFPWA